jgi:site-specific recombinase XerD
MRSSSDPQTTTVRPSPGSLRSLVDSWGRSLRAQRRSPATRKSYATAADQFLGFLEEAGMPTAATSVRREHVEAFLVALEERGASASTMATRYRALQQFWKWCAEEGEVTKSPMANMRPPKVPDPVTPVLTEDDVHALLATCKGRGFEDRRDTAIIRLLDDTGMRRGELAGLTLDDIDLDDDIAYVVGKGDRPRACPFGADTSAALDRYLRSRRGHKDADRLGDLWLGVRGRGAMTDGGVGQMLRRRGREAGLGPIHAHQFRHSFAHKWLADGGQEGDLMRLAGWKSRTMLQRYGASAADERARDAYRRMRP